MFHAGALVLGLLALSPVQAGSAPARIGEPSATVFLDVAVVDVEAGVVREHQAVLVRGDRIALVEPMEGWTPPSEVRAIDARGRFLLPGLAEMHGHLPGPGWPAGLAEDVLFLYAASGVTTVRGMLGDPGQLELRERIARGELVGPRLFVGSPPLSGGTAPSAERAAELVEAYHAAGYDHLKVHEGLSPEAYEAVAGTAHDLGMDFAGHVADRVGLFAALDAGQRTIDHLDNFVEALVPPDAPTPAGLPALVAAADPERLPEVVERTRRSGAAVVPTMRLWKHLFGGAGGDALLEELDEVRYMPASMVEGWRQQANAQTAAADPAAVARLFELRDRVLAALSEGGVPVLLGTDSPQLFSVPGFSIRREMEAMVEAGMANADVLRSGTIAVARFLGEEPGRRADLVLLRADPLDDVANVGRVEGVMLRGRWLPRDALDERLDRIEAASAAR